MGHRHRHVTFMLSVLTTPGFTAAQTVTGMSNLPPVRVAAKPDYGLSGLIRRPNTIRSRETALLERLFVPDRGFGTTDHRHAAALAIGGIEVTTEAMRERRLTASGGLDRKARVVDQSWAAGIHADWAVGADDSLSLGVAADKDKRAEAAILPGTTHIKGSALATDLTWTHGGNLEMSLGWRADRSSSPAAGAERLVELAQGAALREQGIRMRIGYLLEGRDPSRNATFGVAARDARVADDDLATIGSSRRQDVQTALFFRSSF